MKLTLREDREFLVDINTANQVYLCPCTDVGASYMTAMNVGIPKNGFKDNSYLYDGFNEICDQNLSFYKNSMLDPDLQNEKLNKKVIRVWGVSSNAARNAWYKMNIGDFIVFYRGKNEHNREYYAIGTVSHKIESSELSYYFAKKGYWQQHATDFKYIFFIENYNLIQKSKEDFAKSFGITTTYPATPFKLFPGEYHKKFPNVQLNILNKFKNITAQEKQTTKKVSSPIKKKIKNNNDNISNKDLVTYSNSLKKKYPSIASKSKKPKSKTRIVSKPKKSNPKKNIKTISMRGIEIKALQEEVINQVFTNNGSIDIQQVHTLVDKITNKTVLKRLIKNPDIRNLKKHAGVKSSHKSKPSIQKTSIVSKEDRAIDNYFSKIGLNDSRISSEKSIKVTKKALSSTEKKIKDNNDNIWNKGVIKKKSNIVSNVNNEIERRKQLKKTEKKIQLKEKKIASKKKDINKLLKQQKAKPLVIKKMSPFELGETGGIVALPYLIGNPKPDQVTKKRGGINGFSSTGYLYSDDINEKRLAASAIRKIFIKSNFNTKNIKYWSEQAFFALYEQLISYKSPSPQSKQYILNAMYEINKKYIEIYELDVFTSVYSEDDSTFDYRDYSDYYAITELTGDSSETSYNIDISQKILDQVGAIHPTGHFQKNIEDRFTSSTPRLKNKSKSSKDQREENVIVVMFLLIVIALFIGFKISFLASFWFMLIAWGMVLKR